MNPIYERQIFQRLPHLLFLNNVRIQIYFIGDE